MRNDGTILALGATGLIALAVGMAASGEPRLHVRGSRRAGGGRVARAIGALESLRREHGGHSAVYRMPGVAATRNDLVDAILDGSGLVASVKPELTTQLRQLSVRELHGVWHGLYGASGRPHGSRRTAAASTAVEDHLRELLDPATRALIGRARHDLYQGPTGAAEDYPGWEPALAQIRAAVQQLPSTVYYQTWSGFVYDQQPPPQQSDPSDLVAYDTRQTLLGELAPYV